MEVGYIITIIFAVIWLVFKFIELDKKRKADIQKMNDTSNDDFDDLLIK